MKISEQTKEVLKNFSNINQNLLVKSGTTLTTMSTMKNIVAKAEVKESFPKEFAIYDLNEFLSALSLFGNPDLDFQENYVVITEGKTKNKTLKYFYSDPSVIVSPSKEVQMPEAEVSFEFKHDTFNKVAKASAVLGLSDLCVQSTGDTLEVVALDKKTPSSNTYSIELGELPSDGPIFKFYFKVENLKMLSGDYDVEIASSSVAKFSHKTLDLKYWIALESDSSYGG